MEKEGFIPVYRKLTDYYRRKIQAQEISPGQRMDSINKIRERHKVSRETAKLVLRKLSEDQLVISRAGKGTFAVNQTSIKKIWGVILPFYSSNIEQLIGYLKDEASGRGRRLTYFLDYNDPEEEIKLVSSMITEGYEAIIVVPNYNEMLTADFYRKLIPGKTRVVLIDNTMAGSHFRYVIQSYDLGVKRALIYLAEKNKGNFLLVSNDMWKGRNLLNELIEHTFRSLTQELYPDRKIFIVPRTCDLTYEMLINNNIRGILSYTDIDSVKVLGRLKKWNIKIPDHISLVSYGNTELTAFFQPSITAIDCRYDEMALHTAQLIEEKNKKHILQYVIQPQLIIRET